MADHVTRDKEDDDVLDRFSFSLSLFLVHFPLKVIRQIVEATSSSSAHIDILLLNKDTKFKISFPKKNWSVDFGFPVPLRGEFRFKFLKRKILSDSKIYFCRHSSVVYSLPTILWPRVRIPCTPSLLFQIVLLKL